MEIQAILEKPDAVVLTAGTRSHPEWEGRTLAQILAAAPEEGLRLLDFLSNGYRGAFELKLAATLLLARHYGWGPYAPSAKPRPKPKQARQAAGPPVLTGAVLKAAMVAVGKVVRRKASLEILRQTVVARDAQGITFTATDLETRIRVALPFAGPEGQVAVSPARLKAAAEAAGKAEVGLTIGSEPCWLTVQRPGGQAELAALDAEDFPSQRLGELVASAEVDLQLLASVATAANCKDSRPVLTGIYLGRRGACPQCGREGVGRTCSHCIRPPLGQDGQAQGGQKVALVPDGWVVTAADGYRLVVADLPALPQDFPEVIIPAVAVKTASQLIGRPTTVHVHRRGEVPDDYTVVFQGPAKARPLAAVEAQVEVSCSNVPGRFPDVASVIPRQEQTPASFVAPLRELLHAADSLRGLVGKDGLVLLHATKDGLRLQARVESGQQEARAPVLEIARPTVVALNVRYLLDMLRISEGQGAQEIRIRAGLPSLQAGGWRPTSTPIVVEKPFLWVIMPMHYNGCLAWRDLEIERQHAAEVVEQAVAGCALAEGRSCPSEEELEQAVAVMVETQRYTREAALEALGWREP